MSNTPKIFNIKTCPLRGSNLLEAGAGTGKTFSLAYLYLRLLLERGLRVEEILVTTFTNAATAELKSRIFETIQSAEHTFNALCLDNKTGLSGVNERSEEAFLQELLQDIRRQIADDELLRRRLRLALAQFDYAQVFTINGFALHLLREHADVLDSYVPEEILNDDSEFVKQSYLELARDNFRALDAPDKETNITAHTNAQAVGQAVANFNSADLFSLLAAMLRYPGYIDNGKDALFRQAEAAQTLLNQALNSDHAEIAEILLSAFEKKQLKRNIYKEATLRNNLSQLADAGAYQEVKFLEFFSREKLRKARSKDATETFEHSFFELFDELHESAGSVGLLAHIEQYRALLALVEALQQRVAELKAERMALTHDDIVERAANGATRIRTPLKCALIDEAQDTNTQQMQLFRALFLDRDDNNSNDRDNSDNSDNHTDDSGHIVFFVGDPKQAIYGFRGANLYSYIEIQNEVEHHYVMETNYRSTQAVNDSINAFFSGSNPFQNDKIPYRAINWVRPDSDSDFGSKSLTLIHAETGSTETLAQTAANALAAILRDHDITAKDIAVLTRTGNQAKQVKTALAQHGLSASFTGKLSLYESDEAKLLLALLKVVHSGDMRLVKSLMLTPLFGYTFEQAHDNATVTALRVQLHRFAEVYVRNGFSVMFYRLIKQFELAGRLLQSADGKRRLTNFIQLFELLQNILQQQSLSLAGLCDRLSKHIHDADSEAELRLEDDNAVTIMTIHTAKGLEFPVVCLPFFDYASPNNRRTGLLVSHQAQSAAPAFLKPADLQQFVADEEAAENRRLAYVALTRAKYHNVLICQPADSKRNKKGAMLPELLGTLTDMAQITQADFVAEPPELPDCDADSTPVNTSTDTATDTQIDISSPIYRAKMLQKPLYSAWQLESFSRLQQQTVAEHPVPVIVATDNKAADSECIDSALMDYPAGPRPGTALHEMYEHYLAHRQNNEAFHAAIDTGIDKHLYAEDKASRPDTVSLANAIVETAETTLIPFDFCLSDIALTHQSIEMKFFLHLSPEARRQLLVQFNLYTEEHPLIPTDGYLHGYIDYCFEHNGKYFVLDYKSNRLGETFDDYSRDNMHAEMQRHRYDLQALIYTLALCKHLRINDEDDYNTRIGGYFYLFVRGIKKSSNNNNGIYSDKMTWKQISRFLINRNK